MKATKACIASVLALFACSSRPEDGARGTADPPTGQAVLQAAATCDLRQSGVAFKPSACETCMQQKCCGPTTACFSGNPDCTALHACLIACPPDHPITIPAGPGAPQVDAKTQREVENPCAVACEEAHAGSVELRSTYDRCIRSQCMPACEA